MALVRKASKRFPKILKILNIQLGSATTLNIEDFEDFGETIWGGRRSRGHQGKRPHGDAAWSLP